MDGTRGGLATAEITNWRGLVLPARPSDLADLLKRGDALNDKLGAFDV